MSNENASSEQSTRRMNSQNPRSKYTAMTTGKMMKAAQWDPVSVTNLAMADIVLILQ